MQSIDNVSRKPNNIIVERDGIQYLVETDTNHRFRNQFKLENLFIQNNSK